MEERKGGRFDRLTRQITVTLVAFTLLALPILTFLNRKNSYSWYENRQLAGLPALQASTVSDGSFFTGLEACLSDRFYRRDAWMRLFTFVQMKALRKPVVNEVVLADDLLLPYLKPVPPASDYPGRSRRVAGELARLKETAEAAGGQLICLGLPEQYSLLAHRYPPGFFNNQVNLAAVEEAFFAALAAEGIEAINMRPLYEEADDKTHLYSAIDHHYRLEGAYLAYVTLCQRFQALNLPVPLLGEEDFVYDRLPNPAYGSRSRKLYGLSPVGEAMSVYRLVEPLPFSRRDDGEEVEATVFHLPQSAEAAVDYTVYMGGDVAETVIRTDRPELLKVLLVGNSYTNALECFLYTSFDETRSLDLRHYQEKNLLDYVEDYRPDLVIYLRYDLDYLEEGLW